MKSTSSRAAWLAAVTVATAALGLARRSGAAVGLTFTNVGATTSVATVAPGATFTVSANITASATTDRVTGADYQIGSSTGGIVAFLSRNSSGGLFSSPNGSSDATLNASGNSPRTLNPTNGTDLGTSLTNPSASLAGPVTADMADYAFRVLPAAAPGIYTLTFAGYGGSPSPTYLGPPPNYATTQLNSTAPFVLVVPGLIDVAGGNLTVKGAGTVGLSAATAEAVLGYNAAGGGNWSGTTGLTSSTAAADPAHLTAVGVILNNANGTPIYGGSTGRTFDGTAPGPNDVLVKYTYYGDANLDGKVDGQDYGRIDAGFAAATTAAPLTGWYNGDFNYDGVVDGSDYTLIDNAFNNQGATLPSPAMAASPTADVAAGSTAVPEPTAATLVVVAAVGRLCRRRRDNGRRR